MNILRKNHQERFGSSFSELLAGRKFVDVTLACEGRRIHCHRVVLAASSPYFSDLLGENPAQHQHPIVILPKDIKFWTLQALIQFMYQGEISVTEEDFRELAKSAEILQICGISRASVPSSANPKRKAKAMKRPKNDFLDFETEDTEHQLINEEEDPLEESQSQDEVFVDEPDTDHEEETDSKKPLKTEVKGFQDECSSSSAGEEDYSRDLSPISAPDGDRKRKIFEQPPKNFSIPVYSGGRTRTFSRKDMWTALMEVKAGTSIGRAAKIHKIPPTSLHRYARRYGITSRHSFTKGKGAGD